MIYNDIKKKVSDFMKLFVDDLRDFPESFSLYNCTRTYNGAIQLLDFFREVVVINLDYDLGTKETGLDILKYIYENKIPVKHIIIHSTDLQGVSLMEKYIKEHFKDVLYTYSGH